MWRLSVVVVVLCITVASASSCPKDCRCPPDTPRCAAGVGLTVDDCGCCEVCARQLYEGCSEMRPCDRTKGLACNVGGGGHGPVKGICRAEADGRTCEYNNKMYQNGEIFRPNRKHQCTCMDGAVGCVSLCPHELTLPKPGGAKPGRVKAPGRRRRVCREEAKTRSSVAKKKHKRNRHGKDGRPSGGDFADRKESNHVRGGELKSSPDFSGHPMGQALARRVECVSKTTAWSPCSRSCGTGWSTRVTNGNSQCKLVEEARICHVRPCSQMTIPRFKKGQQCEHTEKASRPVRLSHAGCRSLRRFRLRHCGSCPEDGRCCSPRRTRGRLLNYTG